MILIEKEFQIEIYNNFLSGNACNTEHNYILSILMYYYSTPKIDLKLVQLESLQLLLEINMIFMKVLNRKLNEGF